jgi:hypothetical protein
VGLGCEELRPGGAGALWCGVDSGGVEDLPHGGGADPVAKTGELAVDSAVSPGRIFGGQAYREGSESGRNGWSAGPVVGGRPAAPPVRRLPWGRPYPRTRFRSPLHLELRPAPGRPPCRPQRLVTQASGGRPKLDNACDTLSVHPRRTIRSAPGGHARATPGLGRMASTVKELADELGVGPDYIQVLVAQHLGDVPLWDEPVAPAPEVRDDLSRELSPTERFTALSVPALVACRAALVRVGRGRRLGARRKPKFAPQTPQLSDILRGRRPRFATALLEPHQPGDGVLLVRPGPPRRLRGAPQLKPPNQLIVGRRDQRLRPRRDRVIAGTRFRDPHSRDGMPTLG